MGVGGSSFIEEIVFCFFFFGQVGSSLWFGGLFVVARGGFL